MRCDLCGFLIIKPQTTLRCDAMRCTITYGAVRLYHFAGDFSAVFTVW